MEWEWFWVVVILYNCGIYVSYFVYYKYFYYLICNVELLGYIEIELELIVNIVCYYCCSKLKKCYDDYIKLFEFYCLVVW